KSLVKKLKKDYEMNNVSEGDTYSKVLDKYARKIGYSKLLEKEADLFNAVKKNTEKALSEGSLNINNNYLASKIYELQQEKAPLQAEFTKIFDVLFEEQQKSNPEEERVIEPIQNTELEQTASELSQEQVFRLGG